MIQSRTICLAVVCFLTAGVISSITIGVLVYFHRSVKEPEPVEEQMFHGQIRIMSIGGEKLKWGPQLVNDEAEETKKVKATLQTYFVHSLAPTDFMLRSVSVNRFYEDKFDRLLQSNDRGVLVEFDIGTVLPNERSPADMVEEIRYQIVRAFHLATEMHVDLDSLEFQEKPIVQPRSFESFEAYLASDRVNIDLSLTELPGLNRPQDVVDDVMCQPIKPPVHGSVLPITCTSKMNELNQVCKFSCQDHYKVVGSPTLSCLSTGNWSDIVPLCKAECQPLEGIRSLSITPKSCMDEISLSDTRCHYSCPSGKLLDGNPSRVCLDNGRWSGITPVCKETCMVVGPLKNGQIWPKTCATSRFIPTGTYCSFFCDDGFVLAGSPSLHCDADGSWSFPVPTCRRGCPTLLAPKNGKLFPEFCEKQSSNRLAPPLVVEGVFCIYSCNQGFVLEGPEMRMCASGGIWTGTDAYCAQMCPPLMLPHLMLATPGLCTDKHQSSKVAEGLVCHVSCPNNYRTSSNITDVTCKTNGVWSDLPRKCIRTCPILSRITNGMLMPELCSGPDNPIEGTTCSVACMKNFDKRGIGSATCLSTGRWSNRPAECVKRCPVLSQVKYGSIRPANCTIKSLFQKEICHYACKVGYGLVGVAQRVCLTDGTWSSSEPYCRVETQFLIRQTSADHDICISVNPVTKYVEKKRISSCDMTNRFQNWVILPNGQIKNVEHRQCITAEAAAVNSFLRLEDCDPNHALQMWSWQQDVSGLRIVLLNTDLEISYGYASLGKLMLTPSGNERILPWYAQIFNQSYSLYDIFNNVTCQRLRKPLFTSVIPEICTETQTLVNNTICQFFCPPDRRLFGNDTRICVNGKWTNSYPTCERTCEALKVPALGGGSVTRGCLVGRQNQGTICQFMCNDTRFMLEGEPVLICLESGDWSSARPDCVVYCPALPAIPKGVLFPPECSSSKMRVHSECRLACDFPYVPSGLDERRCLPGGNWSSTSFTCERGCPFPGIPKGPNGTVSCNNSVSVLNGDVCYYSCGYFQYRALAFTNSTTGAIYLAAPPGPAGNITRVCQPNGLFNGTLPTCVSVCPPLMEPADGLLSPSHCSSEYVSQGTVCTWTCRRGFGVRGARHIICLETGLWSETAFFCEKETQFHIFNDNFDPSCLNVNTRAGVHSNPSTYDIFLDNFTQCETENSSIWTWISDFQIQHVETGYCLSVKDFEAKKDSELTLKSCSDTDMSQKWRCGRENPLFLFLFNYDLYLHYDEALTTPVAYRHSFNRPRDIHEEWMAENIDNSTGSVSLCNLHTDACAPFRAPPFSSSPDADCDGNSIAPFDTICHIRCQPGYIFEDLFFDTVVATCNSSTNTWAFQAPDEYLPLTCSMPCPALTVETGTVLASESCVSGKAFFNDVCQFSCLGDLQMIGSDTSICGYNGVWSDPVPICTGVCVQERPVEYNISNISTNASSLNCPYDDQPFSELVSAGTRCFYECPPPYLPDSVMTRECLITNDFSDPHPTCNIPTNTSAYLESLCGEAPAHPQNVGRLVDENQCVIGGETRRCAWYDCSVGFNIATANFIHCRAETYTWGPPPPCKRSCPDRSPHCIGYVAGQTCLINCEGNLVISQGCSRVFCRDDGTWSDAIPDCVEKLQFRIAVPINSSGQSSPTLYCMVNSGRLSFDRYIRLTPCSTLAANDRTALWSWEGPYLLRHTQSSYCIASYRFSHGTRLTLAKCNLLNQLQQWKCSADAKRPYIVASRYKGEYVWASSDFITRTFNSDLDLGELNATEPRLVHYSSLPMSSPYNVTNTVDIPDQYSWIGITSASSNASLVMKTLCASTATHLREYLCPPLASAIPLGGRMVPTSCAKMWSSLGQNCAFDCIPGYALRSSSATNTSCTSDGVWTTLGFLCELACSPLTSPKFGSLSCSGTNGPSPMKGDVCTATCDAGYELFGPSTRTCDYDGRWSGNEPFCAKRCSLLPMPQNAEVTPIECSMSKAGIIPDTICLYTCFEEFRISIGIIPGTSLVQSAVRTCFRNGTWSGNPLLCNRVCPPQNNPEHGRLSPITCTTDNSIAGFKCTLQCDSGYALFGNNTRMCGMDGTWINSVTADLGPPCRSSCPAMSSVPNVDFTCTLHYTVVTGESYVVGTECVGLCKSGFGFAPGSTRTRTCYPNRVWSGSEPECIREDQFAIFLYRTTVGSRNVKHVCLVSDEKNAVKKIDFARCLDEAGLCLSVKSLNLSARITTAQCDDHNYQNEWSCTSFRSDGSSFFFRLLDSDFFIDIGFVHTEALFLHNTSLLSAYVDHVHWYSKPYDHRGFTPLRKSKERTICANRKTFGICPPLAPPEFGNVHPDVCSASEKNITAYMKCSFECNVGYRLIGGMQTSECMPSTGLWTAFTPLCARICPNLDPLENGVTDPSSCVEPDIQISVENKDITEDRYMAGVLRRGSCTFQCDEGWRLVGPHVLTCLESGMWDAEQPTCKKKCPRLVWPDHAVAIDSTCLTSVKVQGDICGFRCEEGYGAPKAESHCGAESVVLADTDSGRQFCEKFDRYTEMARDKGRGYDDEIFLTCMSDGQWVGDEPVCFPLCEPLSYPEHGFVEPESCSQRHQAVGSECSYACEDRYALRGDLVRFTCVDGKWIPTQKAREYGFDITPYKENYRQPIPACDKYCLPLTFLLTTYSTFEPPECSLPRIEVGMSCQLHCASGYTVQGNKIVKCKGDGTWSDVLGSCVRKCRALKIPANGVVMPYVCSTVFNPDGSMCTFACFDNYALDGEVSTECLSSGEWTNPEPKCRRRCLPLPRFYNGVASPNDNCYSSHIIRGNTCSFTCDPQFHLIGSSRLTCLENGNWDKLQPSCHKICSMPFVPNGRITCNIRGEEIAHEHIRSSVPTWGSTCKVECDHKHLPTHSSRFICRNNGAWLPTVPQCLPSGVPMYIMQRGGAVSVCLAEDQTTRTVVQITKEQCLNPTEPDYGSIATWRWMGNYNLQNGKTGRCFSLRHKGEGEILRTDICDPNDPLQHWECSAANAFQLVLRGTDLAPTTYYRELKEIVVQRWNDWHSYYSTFDLLTFTHSSLCSRRPGGKCPALPDVLNATLQPSEQCQAKMVDSGQLCQYQCDSNHIILRGKPFTICMLNGIWSNPPPVCGEYCEPLVTLPRASYLKDSDCVFKPSPIGKVCNAFCKEGFEAVGDVSVECTAFKTWSPFAFQCLPVCPAIFGLVDGSVSPSPCTSNVCTFKCLPGYVLSTGTTSTQLICQDGGTWNDDMPKCIRESQFRIIAKTDSGAEDLCITVVDNPTRALEKKLCTDQDFQDATQLFKWKSNRDQLIHAATGLCITGSTQRFGSVTLEECFDASPLQLWDCGVIPAIQDYSLHIKNQELYIDIGAAVDPFGLIKPDSPLNQIVIETDYYHTSKWYGLHHFAKGTLCSFKEYNQCPRFPDINRGSISPPACQDVAFITKGMICEVECLERYSLQEAEKSVCQQDGTWSLPLPICVGLHQCNGIVITEMFLKVEPSTCTRRTVIEGTRCYFSCPPDHHLVGEKLLLCIPQGQWSSSMPTCRPSCPALRYVPDGEITPKLCYSANSAPGAVCKIACSNSTHELLGSVTRVCGTDGSWSGEEAICLAYCPGIAPPSSGSVFPDRCTTNSNYEENTCTFECNEHYVMIGAEYITCYDGKWDGPVPRCAPSALCERIHANRNGVQNVFYKNLIMGVAIGSHTEVTVVCKLGYTLVGPTTRSCMSNGMWDIGTPICLISCPPVLPPNYGVVDPPLCSFAYIPAGSTCTVICDPGTLMQGDRQLFCRADGSWTSSPPICAGGINTRVTHRPFVVAQYDRRTRTTYCLRLESRSKHVQATTDCQHAAIPLQYQFRWWGDMGQIESLSMPNFCWSLAHVNETLRYENFYYAKLVVEPCNQQITFQHFHCDDVTLRQYALRIGTSDLWIGRLRDDVEANPDVNLVRSVQRHELNWEAFFVHKILQMGGIKFDQDSFVKRTTCNLICGGSVTSSEGTIASPGYPTQYPPNTVCIWTIAANRTLRLWITDIDTEFGMNGGNEHCKQDILTILEGKDDASDNSNIIAETCGTSLTPVGPFVVQTGKMILRFKSAHYQTKKRGFRVRWDSQGFPPPMTHCQNFLRAESTGNRARIVGGKPENIASVPWQAAIFEGDVSHWLCGAVLISERYALTAAHCLSHIKTHDDLERVIIAFGSGSLWRLKRAVLHLHQYNQSISSIHHSDGASAHRLRDLFIHPGFDDELRNDIAVLSIASKVTWNNNTYPVCLPPSNVIPSALGKRGNLYLPKSYCTIAGWNSESESGEENGDLSSIKIPILSDRHCAFASRHVFGRNVDTRSFFCAGHVDGRRQSPCDGDEGGGFICTWNDNYYAIGIASQQLGDCGSLNAPRFFTRVASFRDWIDDVIRRADVRMPSQLIQTRPKFEYP